MFMKNKSVKPFSKLSLNEILFLKTKTIIQDLILNLNNYTSNLGRKANDLSVLTTACLSISGKIQRLITSQPTLLLLFEV